MNWKPQMLSWKWTGGLHLHHRIITYLKESNIKIGVGTHKVTKSSAEII